MTRSIGAGAFLMAMLATAGALAVPAQIPYSGYLSDADDGQGFDGAVKVEAALYAQAEGGQALWGPCTFEEVEVKAGHLYFLVGKKGSGLQCTELATGDLLPEGMYLEVALDDVLLTPRQWLGSVAYALQADDAERLAGKTADQYVTGTVLDGKGYVVKNDLAEVALTGKYLDLDGKPDLSGYALTSTLKPVCFSGTYADLVGMPDLTAFLTLADLATVAATGNYKDLLDTPDLAEYVKKGQAGGITAGMLAPDSVTGTEVANGSLAAADLGDWGCQDGQVAKWVDGSGVWTCANDLGGGDAQYSAGAGLVLQGTEFSVSQAAIEGWAQGVCYNSPAELAQAVPAWDQDASDDLTLATVFAGDVQGGSSDLQLKPGVVALADIGQNGCSSGNAMIWSGSAWACTSVYSQGQANATFDPVGSADAVADDLASNYYTSAQLSDGQLDTRYYTEQECVDLFAPKATTYSKTEVDQKIAGAVAAAIAALDECPAGYTKVADANIPATGFYCRKAVGGGKYDEMAKVGNLWIDRYEVSIWQNSDCTGTQYGGASDNWASSGATGANGDNGFFPKNGNWTTKLYGCSLPGVTPSRWMTWFQAQQVCVLQGKYLCTNGEWQMAAAGTSDPGAYPDKNLADGCTAAPITGKCNTCSTGLRATGDAWSLDLGNSCMSAYGAFDMVGNLSEWADLWGQAGRDMNIPQGASAAQWPTGYGADDTYNINGEAHDGGTWKAGLPASALRGASWDDGVGAGVFTLALSGGPSQWHSHYGARCCRRK